MAKAAFPPGLIIAHFSWKYFLRSLCITCCIDALSSAKSLEAAKDLQIGKEIGRIGYYSPDMGIKGNLLTSMTGFGFLYKKRE